MTKALISIDYTVDFVADDGKLTAGAPAQAISETIAQVTQLAFDQGAYVFFAIDAHDVEDPFHPESKLFPPHNIIGTSGRDLYGPLADFIGNTKRIHVSFGWTSVIILLFRELTWISVFENVAWILLF